MILEDKSWTPVNFSYGRWNQFELPPCSLDQVLRFLCQSMAHIKCFTDNYLLIYLGMYYIDVVNVNPYVDQTSSIFE